MADNVEHIRTYDITVNSSEICSVQLGLEKMIEEYKQLKVNLSKHDISSGEWLDNKIREMEQVLERLKDLF